MNAAIVACERDLEEMLPEHEEKVDKILFFRRALIIYFISLLQSEQLQQLQERASHIRSRIEALYGKQGRGAQFSSKQERDKFLQTQITALAKQSSLKDKAITKLQQELKAEESR